MPWAIDKDAADFPALVITILSFGSISIFSLITYPTNFFFYFLFFVMVCGLKKNLPGMKQTNTRIKYNTLLKHK
jgi:hypothetical protein